MVDKFADTLLLLCVFPAVFFLVNYATRSKWRTELSGRTILYLIISLTLILTQNILSVWIGLEYFGRSWIRAMLYTGLFAALCQMNYALDHYQKLSKREFLRRRRLADAGSNVPANEPEHPFADADE